MIKGLFARIFRKKKIEQTDAQKAAERLKLLFISDPYIPLENADDINLLCRYVQESVPVSDIKATLDEIRTQKILCEEWGQPVRARGLMDAIMIVNKHMGIHGKLEGVYGLSDNT